jgi:hypothetical protein
MVLAWGRKDASKCSTRVRMRVRKVRAIRCDWATCNVMQESVLRAAEEQEKFGGIVQDAFEKLKEASAQRMSSLSSDKPRSGANS